MLQKFVMLIACLMLSSCKELDCGDASLTATCRAIENDCSNSSWIPNAVTGTFRNLPGAYSACMRTKYNPKCAETCKTK